MLQRSQWPGHFTGGAAIGDKLANPDKTVIATCSDGTFLLLHPVHGPLDGPPLQRPVQ